MTYAHIREDGDKQTIREHLENTAELCASFAGVFGCRDLGYLTGLMHDIGKYSVSFQKRLLQDGPKVDHATAGAFECISELHQPHAAFCVAGHHSGLPDGGSRTDGSDQATFCGRMNRAQKKQIPDCSRWRDEVRLPSPPALSALAEGKLAEDFLVRMLFSCLTDADYLDTERFMSVGVVERDSGETVAVLTSKLDAFIRDWYPPKTELNRQRCAILTHCINSGDDKALEPGLFTLTVPTGGGKTVASLAFALHHARTYGKRRVIYVIPYTSIIEQTADTFRKILGDENVLEHHAGVLYDTDEETTPDSLKKMRAAENWNMPVIVTTAVQFFESIYSNRSSKCRKLHNLADSVIVFDEAQMLPLTQLQPCVSAITQLAASYGVSAVLCTATQPSLSGLIHGFLPDAEIRELCPATVYDPDCFRRVTFTVWKKTPWPEIAEAMQQRNQVLCIVNTRKNAKELYALLDGTEGVYHLSTMMVPAHRRSKLAEIRDRLINGLPCRVVSTSLMEAGVDVDFPCVFRELNGLDSMLQAAGRCNREGKRSAAESDVILFYSEQRIPSMFEKNAQIGEKVLERYSDIASEEAVSFYFRELLALTDPDALDHKGIIQKISSGTFPFAEIAKAFKMIENDTVTVYIPWGKGEELIRRLRFGERSKSVFREATQYSVQLYRDVFVKLCSTGDVVSLDSDGQIWALTNLAYYRDADGIVSDIDTGCALFC